MQKQKARKKPMDNQLIKIQEQCAAITHQSPHFLLSAFSANRFCFLVFLVNTQRESETKKKNENDFLSIRRALGTGWRRSVFGQIDLRVGCNAVYKRSDQFLFFF